MTRPRAQVRRLAAAAVLVALAAAGPAQEQVIDLSFSRGTPQEQKVRARVLFTSGSSRFGGYGWVNVHLHNPDARPHQVQLVLSNEGSGFDTFTVRKSLRVAAGESASAVLPMPCTGGNCSLDATADGFTGAREHLPLMGPSAAVSVLVVCDDPSLHADWQAALAKVFTATATPAPPPGMPAPVLEVVMRRPQDLPDRWFLMSGFDLVVVDLGAPGLAPERQRLLADHASGGGQLLLVNRAAATAGPLWDLAGRQSGAESAPAGFGAWYAEDRRTPESGVIRGSLDTWLTVPPTGVFRRPLRLMSGPPHDALLAQLVIPGLGTVPVALFLVLILGFVGVVAAQSWHFVRRRRRPLALLVAVPVTGLTCTAALLLYGLFSEGLGIKGSERSFTMLDQGSHESTSIACKTLYAGLAPSALVPAVGTALYSIDLAPGEDRPHRLRIDLDAGLSVGGAALPSRIPTTLTTVSRGPARERLRFRKAQDGGIEMLADPGFAPVDEDGAVLLCGPDGRLYGSTGSGRMERVPEDGALKAAVQLRERFLQVRAGRNEVHLQRSGRHWGYDPESASAALETAGVQQQLSDWIDSVASRLVPGTYLAWMRDVPSVDDLGLTVQWRARGHLVLGKLAPEDFVE